MPCAGSFYRGYSFSTPTLRDLSAGKCAKICDFAFLPELPIPILSFTIKSVKEREEILHGK